MSYEEKQIREEVKKLGPFHKGILDKIIDSTVFIIFKILVAIWLIAAITNFVWNKISSYTW